MKMLKKSICLLLAAVLLLSVCQPLAAEAAVARPVKELEWTWIPNPLYPEIPAPAAPRRAVPSAFDPSEKTYMELEDAALLVRAGMVQRQEVIDICLVWDVDDPRLVNGSVSQTLFNLAVAHTGDPLEGDALKHQYAGCQVGGGIYTKDGRNYLDGTLYVQYFTTAEQEQELNDAIDRVLSELALDGLTEYQKVKKIYDYITANVAYDYEHLTDEAYTIKFSAYAALIHGTSVCQGYTVLLYRMLLAEGIDCRVVVGDAGGPHAWNIIRLGDVYYNADSTWDEEATPAQYRYFLKGDGFYNDHQPDPAYQTLEFRSAYPMSPTDYDPGAHSHAYTETHTPADCVTDGSITYTCACGYSYVRWTEPKLGHDFCAWYDVREATESQPGLEQRDCARCGASEQRETDHIHSYTAVVTAPTCTEPGFTTYTCDCGRSYIADETEPLGHVYLVQKQQPTCSMGGYSTYICTGCGHNYTADETEALGHDFGEWYVTKEATEEAEGEEQRDCSRCDASEIRSIPKQDHVHEYTAIVTAPTCTEPGFTTYTCACGHSYVADETAALGHDYAEGICTGCGEAEPDYQDPTQPVVNPFVDVPEDQWYFEPVLWAVEHKITSGTSATTFAPNATCTRAQVVTFLWRTMGQPEPETEENPFSDVTENDYFYKAVLWAVEKGITAGTGGGKFSPNNPCSRDQVVTFLWRTMGKPTPEKPENPFTDVAEGMYYYQAVLWAVENGITSGTSATTFSPTNPCTRAQVVTFLYRTLKDQ